MSDAASAPDAQTVPRTGRWPREGLVAGQVAVRVWRPDDAAALLTELSDPQVRRWSPMFGEPDLASCMERIATAQAAEEAGLPSSFAVVHSADPRHVVGSLDWRNGFPSMFSIVDVGYAVLPSARGQGFGSAALRLLTRWLTDRDGGDVHRVQLDHAVDNEVSCRTALRAGFAIEGRRAGFLPLRAEPDAPVIRHTVCLHGLVRAEHAEM